MSTRPEVRFLDRATPPHIFTLIAVTGIGALSMNIFLPSLPGMAAYFDTEYRTIQLSVALYLAMNAVLQIAIGPISDRFGRRPILLIALVIFTLATIGCILSPTIEIFLVFRMIQAVMVAGMVIGRAAVRDMVSEEEAASMIGYVTMGMAVVPMIGPVLGGLLDQAFGWQSSFVLLAVAGLGTLWLVHRDLGETATRTSTSFKAQFAEYPELLRARRFWGYCAAAAFSSGAFFAYLGGAPYVGTEVFGLNAAALGLYFGAPALGYMAGNGLSGRFSVRYGINTMILAGTILTAVGLVLLLLVFLAGGGSAISFFGFMILLGLGNGLVLPNATSGMLSVRPQLAGTASGLGGAIMIGGGAALSAIAGYLLTIGTGAYPLILIMLATSLLAVASIIYTIRREARVAAPPAEDGRQA